MPSGHILVVEDHAINRQMLQAQLAAEGWRSEAVSTGRDALQKLSEATPAAVVSDYVLDDMTGIELMQRIRSWEHENRRSERVPVILYSGMPVEFLKPQTDGYDCMAILTKPISRSQLRETLAPLLLNPMEDQDAGPGVKAGENEHDFLDDDATTDELLQELLEFAYQQLERLKEAVEHNDMHEVKRGAHALRGSAAVLRQQEIAQACADIDVQAQVGNQRKILFACGRLHDAIDRLAAA